MEAINKLFDVFQRGLNAAGSGILAVADVAGDAFNTTMSALAKNKTPSATIPVEASKPTASSNSKETEQKPALKQESKPTVTGIPVNLFKKTSSSWAELKNTFIVIKKHMETVNQAKKNGTYTSKPQPAAPTASKPAPNAAAASQGVPIGQIPVKQTLAPEAMPVQTHNQPALERLEAERAEIQKKIEQARQAEHKLEQECQRVEQEIKELTIQKTEVEKAIAIKQNEIRLDAERFEREKLEHERLEPLNLEMERSEQSGNVFAIMKKLEEETHKHAPVIRVKSATGAKQEIYPEFPENIVTFKLKTQAQAKTVSGKSLIEGLTVETAEPRVKRFAPKPTEAISESEVKPKKNPAKARVNPPSNKSEPIAAKPKHNPKSTKNK